MISVSHSQFRIVAAAADMLPAEARGTFLRRLVAELRGSRDFKDSDIERAVRVALLDQSMKQACVSSTDQDGGKPRSDTRTVPQDLGSHPFAHSSDAVRVRLREWFAFGVKLMKVKMRRKSR